MSAQDIVGRGEIRHLDRYKQLISYKGLIRHRGITPTDIDTFIDYNGNAFVYADAKIIGKELERGQRIALENISKSHCKSGKPTIVFIYVHDSPPDDLIIAAECIVTKIYWNGKWVDGEGDTLLNHIDKFEKWCREKNIVI